LVANSSTTIPHNKHPSSFIQLLLLSMGSSNMGMINLWMLLLMVLY
jgi:hypothetical protein